MKLAKTSARLAGAVLALSFCLVPAAGAQSKRRLTKVATKAKTAMHG